jgi:hypothetical protein
MYNHSRDELASFFGEMKIIDPGLGAASAWRSGLPEVPATMYNLCAVGVTPDR